jgi:hypothetical protein
VIEYEFVSGIEPIVAELKKTEPAPEVEADVSPETSAALNKTAESPLSTSFRALTTAISVTAETKTCT